MRIVSGAFTDFVGITLTMGALFALGYLRFRTDRRFRVRHPRPPTPLLLRASRAFNASLGVAGLGLLAGVARMTGLAPAAAARVGLAVFGLGLAGMLASGGTAIWETFRIGRAGRPRGSRPAA